MLGKDGCDLKHGSRQTFVWEIARGSVGTPRRRVVTQNLDPLIAQLPGARLPLKTGGKASYELTLHFANEPHLDKIKITFWGPNLTYGAGAHFFVGHVCSTLVPPVEGGWVRESGRQTSAVCGVGRTRLTHYEQTSTPKRTRPPSRA